MTPCPADARDAEAFRSVLAGADGILLNLPPTLPRQDLARIGADIAGAGSIRDDGAVITAFPDALEVPIAPVDIAVAAVAALTSPGHGPHPTRRLLGPEWLSARDRVAVLAPAADHHPASVG